MLVAAIWMTNPAPTPANARKAWIAGHLEPRGSIKVDAGAKDLALFPGEKITEGLDGLRGRCEEYYSMGARFTKWRAVINIGDGIPTDF